MLFVIILSLSMIVPFVITTIIIGVGMWIINIRNRIAALSKKVMKAGRQVEQEFKKLTVLIPTLIDIVKVFALEEKEIIQQFLNVEKLYKQGTNSGNVKIISDAYNYFFHAVKNLSDIEGSYQELNADNHYQTIKDEINSIENNINFTISFYNDMVLNYNNQIEIFPMSVVRKIFGFSYAEVFELTNNDQIKIYF